MYLLPNGKTFLIGKVLIKDPILYPAEQPRAINYTIDLQKTAVSRTKTDTLLDLGDQERSLL